LRHRFSKRGRYMVAVGSLAQKGGPGHNYQLRITLLESNARQEQDNWTRLYHAHDTPLLNWQERGFTREIHPGRRQQLRARAAGDPIGNPGEVLAGEDPNKPGQSNVGPGGKGRPLVRYPSLVESEPDENPDLALAIRYSSGNKQSGFFWGKHHGSSVLWLSPDFTGKAHLS